MMIVLTPQEAEAYRKSQVERVAQAVRKTRETYPDADPAALCHVLELCGTNMGLMVASDFSEAIALAAADEAAAKPCSHVNGVTTQEPPEFILPGLVQVALNNGPMDDECSEKFRATIASSLRSPPDMIM